MGGYESFYEGASYSLRPNYGGFNGGYQPNISNIAFPSDPLTANQLKKVSDKISSGAKTIEVSGLGLTGGSPMKHLASIPKQHWKEIDRLRKLTNVDLTFHGPLVEPTGYAGRGNWKEEQRVEVERQMKSAVELAQQMNPSQNVVMTFHSSNGIPEVEKTIKHKDGSEEVVKMAIFNTKTGEIGELPLSKEDYFTGRKYDAKQQLESLNSTQWSDKMESIRKENQLSAKQIEEAFESTSGIDPEQAKQISALYMSSKFGNGEVYKREIKKLEETNPKIAEIYRTQIERKLDDGWFFLRDGAWLKMKDAYNTAYDEAKQTNNDGRKKELEKIGNNVKEVMYKVQTGQASLQELNLAVNKTANELEDFNPQTYITLKEFAVDKASESFANTALFAVENAKKKGLKPGIISIENPPYGLSGLTRANEIKDLVEEARKKFVNKAVSSGMSKNEAKKQAEQVIGATWDVGHINSLRKSGYTEKDVIEEARRIAPYVKHMHIADNLGFEDSELPIGMGNVPLKKIFALSKNFRDAKKVIETGDWFSRQGGLGMSHTPVREAFEGLQSSVYEMGTPLWGDLNSSYGSYFSGLGPINPDVHHSVYGAGFTNLPPELGGQVPGRGSSFSGAPIQ